MLVNMLRIEIHHKIKLLLLDVYAFYKSSVIASCVIKGSFSSLLWFT